MHELLHVAFGNHVDIARKMGFTIENKYGTVPYFIEPPSFKNQFRDKTGSFTVDYNEPLASSLMNKWLLNNCSVDWNFYGGFNGLPDHCQNRVLKDLRIPKASLAADPDTAARIAAFGLRDGLFRPGKGKLSDFTKDGRGTRKDLLKARYLVNAYGLAKGEVADAAIRYWNQIKQHCF